MADDVVLALQGQPESADQWAEPARRAEAAGFDAICVGDHPGLTCSPFVALAVAAAATETITLATAVLNGGVREPLDIASHVATLDLLAPGRVLLGIGTGHTPTEWTATGKRYPSPKDRVDRLGELVDSVVPLLAGDTGNCEGRHLHLVEASLSFVPDRRVPLMIGGNGKRVIRLGARHADIVDVGGLGPTLPDGHFHEIRWSTADVDSISETVRDAGEHDGRLSVLGALVQHVEITDARDRWGFSRYTIRASALDDGAAIIRELSRGPR